MIVSLLLLVLVFAITYRQATFGLFSAMIMAVLTVCCAAMAIGMHEWAAVHLLAPYWKPSFSYAIALGALFGVPLVLLRVLFDKTVSRACLMPVWIDRIGGAIFGFLTGMTMVGIFALCLQMLPMGRTLMGYERMKNYARGGANDPPRGFEPGQDEPLPGVIESEHELLLSPDRFATAAASFLSAGLLADDRPFFRDNPDFTSWVGQVGFVPSEVSLYAPPGSIDVVDTDKVEFVYRLFPGDERHGEAKRLEPLEPKAGHDFRVVRIRLKDAARDEKKSHIFTLRQFRLVGRASNRSLSQLSPVAIQQDDASETVNRHIRFVRDTGKDRPLTDDVLQPRQNRDPKEADQVEIVFSVPKGFDPSFVEYKRGARAPVKFQEGERKPKEASAQPTGGEPNAPAAGDGKSAAGEADAKPGNEGQGGGRGRSRHVQATSAGSFFGDRLPMKLTAYNKGSDTSISGGALESGSVVGRASEQESGSDAPVERFKVPSNKQLLHLNSSMLHAGSTLGGALAQAVGTVQNYTVMDTNGAEYKVIGKYAIANHAGTDYIEVQYYPETGVSMGGLGKFREIKDADIKKGDTFMLLFLVEPGVTIKSFSTGTQIFKSDELGGELVAPN